MTHHVYSVLYVPDINHLAPVGSSGRQFSQRGEHHIPKLLRYSPVDDEQQRLLRRYPRHVGSERANSRDQNTEIFQWHKALKSDVEKKGKKKQCPHRVETQGRRLIFILSTFFAALGGKKAMRAARPRY